MTRLRLSAVVALLGGTMVFTAPGRTQPTGQQIGVKDTGPPRDFEGLWWPVDTWKAGQPPGAKVDPSTVQPPGGIASLRGQALGGPALEQSIGSTLQCAPAFRVAGAAGGESHLWFQSQSNIAVVSEEDMDLSRQIAIGGKHPARLVAQPNGNSVGHWAADTLVVDTVGYATPDGGPTDRHLVERFHKVDGELHDDVHVTESGKIADFTLRFVRRPEFHVWENVCEEGYQHFHLKDGKVEDFTAGGGGR